MRRPWLAILALAVAAPGCTSGTKAGDRPLTPAIVLTIANHESESRDLVEYLAAVERLSSGSMRLHTREDWRGPEIDYDRATIADVRAGKIALAKISVGSLDTLGVNDFQALRTPFLVDSVELEGKVLESPLADQMLRGIGRLGVIAVALLPGEPRRPFGQRRRFLAASDYRGAVFGTAPSLLATATLKALGAQPHQYVTEDLPYEFDGAELDLKTIDEHNYDTSVTSLTGNVVFWPRVFVVVANADLFRKLTAEQRAILRAAGHAAVAPAIQRLRTEETDEAGILCRRRQLSFVEASPADRARLRQVVRPVYRKLERDPKTRSLILAIKAMKRQLPGERPVRCGSTFSPRTVATPLDGTWQMTAGHAYGIDAGEYRLVLRRGRVIFSHLSPPRWGGPPAGAFSLHGDTVLLRFADGGDAIYRWNIFRDTLTLRYTRAQVGPPNPTFAPWHRVRR